jgi:hypothetical protein
MLAPIATTYEYAMTENLGRATWRTDHTYSPCPRAEAGRYLTFLAALGYEMSPIEQAVADGVPYTGDNLEDQLPGNDASSQNGEESRSAAQPDSDPTEVAEAQPDDTDPIEAEPGDTDPEDATAITDQAA